jgi:cytochrome oxidase Cu insertion factor (SCO1/SenC/PrrC family)
VTSSINSNRRMLLLIAGIPVLVILTASWLWFYVASGKLDLVNILGTANRGTLLSPPVPVDELQAVDAAGQAFVDYQSEPALWRILIPGDAGCDTDCQQVLQYTRQIHTAMGKHKLRIQRVFLGLDMDGTAPQVIELAAQYPDMKLLYTAASRFRVVAAVGMPDLKPPAYYLIDPNGWIMLAYSADADGKDLMADLKFLLKNSNG